MGIMGTILGVVFLAIAVASVLSAAREPEPELAGALRTSAIISLITGILMLWVSLRA